MTQEQIQQQAIAYAEFISHNEDGDNYDPYFDGMNAGAKSGFKAGAKWRIDSVWHDVVIKKYSSKHWPDSNKGILIILENGNISAHPKGYKGDWDYNAKQFGFKKWAYIDDLIPQEE